MYRILNKKKNMLEHWLLRGIFSADFIRWISFNSQAEEKSADYLFLS